MIIQKIGKLLVVAFVAIAGCAPKFDTLRLRSHVAYLASDDLQGRGVGSEGIEKAAEYVASQFQQLGLAPAGEAGGYFQSFEVTLGQKLTGRPALYISGAPGLGVLYRDFVPLPFSSAEAFEGPIAFVGYGITNAEAKYDDYGGVDIKGKVLLMFRSEPPSDHPDAPFGGQQPSRHALFETKAELARKQGAAAILVVNPQKKDQPGDRLFVFGQAEGERTYHIPMMHVSRRFAESLLAAGGAADLDTLQADLKQHKNRSTDLTRVTARGNPGIVREKAMTRNVLGLLPGRGSMADDILVVGAHYDHLGIAIPRKLHGGEATSAKAEIHNGADDNASGTAGIIELARAMKASGPPARSVLFIAFSGEEMGLLGSDYFVDHPTIALKRVIAMINLDMVGRLDKSRLQVFGIKTSSQFQTLVEREAKATGLDLATSAGGFGPSDHTSFYKKQIPVLHFFTGVHEDYHQPTDDTEKVNAPGMQRVIEVIYRVAMELIAAKQRPTYVAVAEKATPRMGLKVRMGVMPSYAEDEKPGMALDGVSPGSPAERAGLKEGDILLFIDDTQIDDVMDLMGVLAKCEPGQKAIVTILRDGDRLKLPITFEQP